MSLPSNGSACAFPCDQDTSRAIYGEKYPDAMTGLTKREWFAGMAILIPITETQDVSRCDDQDLLERFGTEEEKERGFIPVSGQKMFIWNIELRASLESRARAILRYAEADAMVAAGEVKQ